MLRHNLILLAYKTRAEIKGEVERNYLGFLWWFIEPLMYLGAFYLVFGLVFQRGGEGFVPSLLIGLVVWKWFDVGIRQSMGAIEKNRGLLSQTYVPKYLFPLISVALASFKFAIIFGLLLVFLVFWGKGPGLVWLALPGLLVLQLLLITGAALLVGAWVPLLRDVRPLIENGLMMMFFVSGVFFDLSRLSGGLKLLFLINPEAVMIDAFRQVLLFQQLPNVLSLGWVLLIGVLLMAGGLATLVRYDRIYPRLL